MALWLTMLSRSH